MRIRALAWGAALATGAAAVARWSATPEGRAIDEELFKLMNAEHGEGADRFLFGVTELGSMYAAAAAAASLAAAGRPRQASRALAAAATTWLVCQWVKRLADRPRPYEADPDGTRRLIAEPKGRSWPSSHPAVLTTFTRVAANELSLAAGARAGLAGLDVSVGASRVYLGVHYPSDVAGGLLVGRAIARLWSNRRA